MNRFRALFLAAVAIGFVPPVLQAATIEVTTNLDVVQDDDDCSIREAIIATVRADELRARQSGKQQVAADMEVLNGQLPRLRIRDEETFARASLLAMVINLKNELASHQPVDPVLQAQTDALEITVQAMIDYLNPPAPTPLPPNPNIDQVEQVIAMQVEALGTDAAPGLVRKEIARLEAANEADGCIDGSAFDVIELGKHTYTILAANGPLILDRRTTIRGYGATDTIIAPEPGVRVFDVLSGASLDLSQLRIAGADLGACIPDPDINTFIDSDDGGAVLVAGMLTAQDVEFSGNRACDGGAVAVKSTGSINLTAVRFTGNQALRDGGAVHSRSGMVLTEVAFGGAAAGEGNSAGGNGGAIYLFPAKENGSITLEGGSVIGNRAINGSGIYVAGNDTGVGLVNVTIARNEASGHGAVAIDINSVAPQRLFLNNISMLENRAGAGQAGGLYVATLGGASVQMSNSVLADNDNFDCDFTGAIAEPSADNFARNYYGSAGGCPGRILLDSAIPAFPPEFGNFRLSGQAAIGFLVSPLAAGADYYLPIFPASDADRRLVNRGASTQDPARCEARDQRSRERASFADVDCDIGAVEYQIGRRVDDIIERMVGTVSCIDVVANDIGDADYVPGSLRVLSIETGGGRDGATAVVVPRSQVDQLCPNAAEIGAADPDAERDVILFEPASVFQGETIVTYALRWTTPDQAISGDISGFARVVTESRGGIASSTLGAGGIPFLLMLCMLAFRRMARAGRLLPVAVLALLSLPVQANENVIFVNSGADPVDPVTRTPILVPGDGLCTLREALLTARNDQANLTGGDCVNGNEGPDIIRFVPNEGEARSLQAAGLPPLVNAGFNPFDDDKDGVNDGTGRNGKVVLVIGLNAPLTAFGGVTLHCPSRTVEVAPAPGVDPPPSQAQECIIRPAVTDDTDSDYRAFSLINSEGSITIAGMILEHGNAGSGNGGAINSRGGVLVSSSILRNNKARTGGAIFLRGVRSDLTVSNSLFQGNISTASTAGTSEGGGAIATSAADEHRIQIESSSFVGNISAISGAALTLKTLRPVIIVNSTFSGNTSTAGPAVLDLGDATGGITLRNLTIVGNQSGVGRDAIEAPGRSVTLTNSILAANYDATILSDANCGAGSFNSTFNLIGEGLTTTVLPSVPTCPPGTGGLLLPADEVFDAAGDGVPVPLLSALTTEFMHVPSRDLAEGKIINAGYNIGLDGNLVSPLVTSSPKCASIDQRGVSRESGGRCDIGAYEYQKITAIDDSGSNVGRFTRSVLIDLLANDLFASEASELPKKDCTTHDRSVAGEVRYVDANQQPCVVVLLDGAMVGDQPMDPLDIEFLPADAKDDDNKLLLATSNPYFLRFRNDGKKLLPQGEPMVLRYRVYTQGAAEIPATSTTPLVPAVASIGSDPADVSIHVENIPPFAYPDVIHAEVGSRVVIDVLANDKEYDSGDGGVGTDTGLDPASVTITGSTCTETPDIEDFDGDGDVVEQYWQCQFGRATIDPGTGKITWVPTNKFNPFRETFSYSVRDTEDEPKESTGSVTIVMGLPQANGGGMLGEDDLSDLLGIDWLGGMGLGSLGLSALLVLRRRRRA